MSLSLIGASCEQGTNWRTDFGAVVAGIGDANGDEIPDFAVGIPEWTGVSESGVGGNMRGRVDVFSGVDRKLLWSRVGALDRECLGSAICAAGDLDSDGHSDVAVTACGDPDVDGRLVFLSGADGRVVAEIRSEASGDSFGAALLCGDIDADGHPDFVVGCPGDDKSGENAGAVKVYSGATRELSRRLWGRSSGDRLGAALALGDVDGDRRLDLIVGAPSSGAWFERRAWGRVDCFSGASGELVRRWHGCGMEENFGISVCGVGDVDGDGADDVAVGVALVTTRGDGGFVRVISGATGVALRELAHKTARRLDWPSQFGQSLLRLDDLDGDGLGELAIGAPWAYWSGSTYGTVSVFSPKSGRELMTSMWSGDPHQREYGRSLALLGDIDRDGRLEWLVGAADDLWGGGVEVLKGRGELVAQVLGTGFLTMRTELHEARR